jgi:tRNA threonylcarbamoyladenosine biosynthesis protein TsaB
MLLAIDTSTRLVGIALYDGVQVLSEMVWQSRSYHTVELAPAVEEILARTGVHTDDLQTIGVATGPGSFTALRIGLALAKGLSFSQHIPLVGVPTLDIIAAAQPLSKRQLAAVIKAGRSRLAVGWYRSQGDKWSPTGKLENLTLEEFADSIRKPTWVCGELDGDIRHRLKRKYKNVRMASPAQSLRRPSYLAALAWQRWQAEQTDDPATLAPIYLHHGEPIPG